MSVTVNDCRIFKEQKLSDNVEKTRLLIMVVFSFLIFCTLHDVKAYSAISDTVTESIFGNLNWQPDALNSYSEVIGNYEIVLTTDPLSPEVNQVTHMQFKVFNYNQGIYGDKSNYAETGVNHFLMGIRMYYGDKLVDTIPPQLHQGNLWNTDYVFRESGNHVLKIDLYDTEKDNSLITYIFNVPVSTSYGPIFTYIVVVAAIGFASTIIWIKISMAKKQS
ncbi:MAG: hypothetical protein ACREA3_06545 [Nitrosotalea sp.]